MAINKYLHIYKYYVLLILTDALFFGLFSPTSSSFVVIPALLLVTGNIFVAVHLLLRYISKIIPLKRVVRRRITVVMAASLAIIIALQSIGQLTIRDVVTIAPLVAILYFYLSYKTDADGRR